MFFALITSAWSLTCQDVLNLLQAGTPASEVASQIAADRVPPGEISCMEKEKVPAEVLEAARRNAMVGGVQVDPEQAWVLAQIMEREGLPNVAEFYYVEAMKAGLKSPHFAEALTRLTRLAFAAGDPHSLRRVLPKIPPVSFPDAVRDELYYLHGLSLMADKHLADAMAYFTLVSETSAVHEQAQFMTGVIHLRQGKLKSGVRIFTTLAQSENVDILYQSRMNIARTYYSINQFDQAAIWYLQAEETPQQSLELAWSRFFQDGSEVGATLRSLRKNKLPEADLLEGIIRFSQNRCRDVEPIYTDFQTRWSPIRAELATIVEAHSLDGTWVQPEVVYQRYSAKASKGDGFPREHINEYIRNNEFEGIRARLEKLPLEKQQASRLSPELREPALLAIDMLEQQLQRRAGRILLSTMQTQVQYLEDLNLQLKVLRFEAADCLGREDALALLREILEKQRDPAAQARLVSMTEGDRIAGYQRITERYPWHEEVWYYLGRELWEAGREDEAIIAFARVGHYSEFKETEAQIYIGVYWFYRKNWPLAKEAFIRGKSPYMLGWTLWAMGDRQGAIEQLRLATEPQATEDLRRMEAAVKKEDQ